MARKLTGQLDPPKKGRPHFSLRIRVNGAVVKASKAEVQSYPAVGDRFIKAQEGRGVQTSRSNEACSNASCFRTGPAT